MTTETDPGLAPPAAAGTRAEWADVPDAVRAWTGEVLGAPVVSARTQNGGFSPGVAARLECADGGRGFVKAVSPDQNPQSPSLHRHETRVTAALPLHPALPRLLASYDDGHWVAMLFEDVRGRPPVLPWRRDELTAVLDTLHELGSVLDPCPLPDPPDVADELDDLLDLWRELAAAPPDDLDPWLARNMDQILDLANEPAPRGTALVHADLRADNLLLTETGQVVLVDWAQAGEAPQWLDAVILLLEVHAHGGHDVERVVADHPLTRAAAPAEVTQTLLAVAAMFEYKHRQPAPPGLPTLRAFQRSYAHAATTWLERRLTPTWSRPRSE